MIEVTGAATPPVSGAASLLRWQEWISIPGDNIGSVDAVWTGMAFGRHFPGSLSAGNAGVVWRNRGSTPGNFRIIPGGASPSSAQVIDFQPLAAVGGAREVWWEFTRGLAAPVPLDFFHTWPAALESAPAVLPSPSCELLAWIRKKTAVATPGARQFFGFYTGDGNWSRRVARVGFAGDGVGGFRFQSNNCPAAPVGAAENGQTDRDANSVQPAALVAPGTQWIHVRLKLIPATETQTGRLLGFLNGRLVATFSTITNLPRNGTSSVDTALSDFWPIMPAVILWGHPDGVTVDPGLYFRDLRVRLVDDWSAA